MTLDISCSPTQTMSIDGVAHYYVDVRYGSIHFRSSAVEREFLLAAAVQAEVSNIGRVTNEGKLDSTLCPRCLGHRFHTKGSRGGCSCTCGGSFRYVGGGRKGEDRGFFPQGVTW